MITVIEHCKNCDKIRRHNLSRRISAYSIPRVIEHCKNLNKIRRHNICRRISAYEGTESLKVKGPVLDEFKLMDFFNETHLPRRI